MRAHRRKPDVEHAGDGEHLEHRAHLVDAEADAVQPVLVERLLAAIGVVVGKRGERQHFAGMHVDDDAGRGLGVIGLDRPAKLLAQHMLRAEIERNRHRLLAAHGELGIVVDEFLDAGEALVVDVDQADHMARSGAHG